MKTQDEGNKVRTLIKATAEIDGGDVEISLPQVPGQAGKVQAKDMVAMLAGWKVKTVPGTGDRGHTGRAVLVPVRSGECLSPPG
ncbi:hypothetical protein [Aliihoeflea sp. 40Bstr573]|uniref:hypothetical protein n=1 Tax=Aliihoeflea sp. 40Bstr573 TaxID=2696467 RepID=UPI0020946F1E|nr:hypothetical protein [Aliihoeflea sp. 40Bstr573]MCO6389353.1 hypothetical protein [Aliihoeflea sp. 40Bstr573]